MPHRESQRVIPFELPPDPDPALLPQLITATTCAAMHGWYFGRISSAAIRRWPQLHWHRLNGRAMTQTTTFLAEARRRFEVQLTSPLPGSCRSLPQPTHQSRKR
jgi:hypothetical protein